MASGEVPHGRMFKDRRPVFALFNEEGKEWAALNDDQRTTEIRLVKDRGEMGLVPYYEVWSGFSLRLRVPARMAVARYSVDTPTSTCPNCSAPVYDFDGFGVSSHGPCGYCSHPAASGDPAICDICERPVDEGYEGTADAR